MSDISERVFSKTATITYLNTTAKNLFTLPRKAKVLFFLVDVNTAFNDSGTDLLDIGIPTDAVYFADDVIVSVAGQVMVQQSNLGDIGNVPRVVQGKYIGQNSNATAGSLTVTCVFSHYKSR